jgi:type I restriction enzyme S subunit
MASKEILSGKYIVYPEYKDSGVEWLGLVPVEWKKCRLKFMAVIKNGQDYKTVQADQGYPVMGSGGQFTWASAFMYDKESVLLGRKGTIDKPLYINEPFWTVDTMYYTEINEDINAKYLYYLALTIQFDRYSTNTALPSMTQEHLGNFTFVVPQNAKDKSKIANFLDHETAKIDTLIDKQQQLITLLKEKRQAVISHAVTKGLNPNAPTRDSGVEWLGEVPEHWSVSQVGHCAFVTKLTGFEYTKLWQINEDGAIVALRGFNVKERKLELNDVERISADLSATLARTKLAKGDIVFPCTGTIGNAAMIEEDDRFHINQNIAKIRFDATVSSRFAIYWLTSSFTRTIIDRNNTSGMQPVVLIGDIRKLPIPRFDYFEQESVADYLDAIVDRFNILISNAESAITLMQERRTALISAAVTGKIDLRNWQAPKVSNNNKEVAV